MQSCVLLVVFHGTSKFYRGSQLFWQKVEEVHKNGSLIKYQFQGLSMAILIITLDDERVFFAFGVDPDGRYVVTIS